jgi:DNA helicase-2/ATP-dependent DNA helicase PcrA
LTPTPRKGVSNVVFSFSDLKYFFECPYQFKLRILYGFNAPIHEALGYGRSLHNALAEVHARAVLGDYASDSEVRALVDTHLHTPYAYPALKEKLESAAEKVLTNYIQDNKSLFDKIEFSEKQIDISLEDGISVVGRIDLVRRIDTNETTIVDLKSSDRTQPEEVTETQLHVYALGYEELTGRRADYVETYDLLETSKARCVTQPRLCARVPCPLRSHPPNAADAITGACAPQAQK